MKRTLLAIPLLLLTLLSACEQEPEVTRSSALRTPSTIEVAMPEVEASPFTVQTPDGPLTLERKNGIAVLQGDILLTEAQVEALRGDTVHAQSSTVRPNAAGLATLATMWPSQTVYYVINGALPNQTRVTDAITHWQTHTNLRFVPRTNQSNYVEFVPGTGCSSSIGMIGGRQVVTLESACSIGNTIHEIGHAVGLLHEQTRRDRDSYVIINWSNIQSGQSHNFDRYDVAGRSGFDYGPFDFNSIMMYGSYDFSANGLPTITKLDGSTFGVNRTYLSSGDLSIINWMYGGPYALFEEVETQRNQDPWNVYVATDYYVTFWADLSHTIPANLGSAIQLKYVSKDYDSINNWTMTTDLTTNLQPGSHSYYLGNYASQNCDYDANGNPDHICTYTWLEIREGFGYATGN